MIFVNIFRLNLMPMSLRLKNKPVVQKGFCRSFISVLFVCIFVSACTIKNSTDYFLTDVDTNKGYYLSNSVSNGSDSILLVLSFSGGGTRAATMAYGVLEKLKQTYIEIDGEKRSLLNEVDLITSVSGGSFTAAYYGLYGDQVFTDFEQKFLKRNFQADLYRLLFSPWHWPGLSTSTLDRSDLAAQYLDKLLFDGATIDAMQRADTPFIMINASEVGFGTQIAFEQRQFDMFCLDVAKMPVSTAVMASSAVPLAFSPITFENKSDQCDNKLPRWVRKALDKGDTRSRNYHLAHKYKTFQDVENYPYIHLYDGVLTDNLGLRSIINVFERQGGAWKTLKLINHQNVRKAVVIVVDAKSSSAIDSGRDKQIKFKDALNSALNVSINSLSFETISMMRENMSGWRDQVTIDRCWEYANQNIEQTDCYEIEPYLIEVSFDAHPNDEEMHELQRIPTTFNLSDGQVDLIKKSASQVLDESAEFQRLLNDLADSHTRLSVQE